MTLSEKEIHLFLKNSHIQQYLPLLLENPKKKNKICGNLTMALYSGAAKTPRFLQYNEARDIATFLVNYILLHPSKLEDFE